jgi:DNA-binding beta-propeller fold protein YncE
LTLASAGVLIIDDAISQNAPPEHVGRLPDGGFLLNSGWTIRPAGEQVPVDTLPMSTAVSNDGKYLLVLNGGYNPPSISVIDIAQKHEIGRTPLPDCWLGLTVAPGGNSVYVGGASRAEVYELSLKENGSLTRTREFAAVPDIEKKGPAFIGDVAVSPDGHLLYAADLYDDSIAVINLQSGRLIDRWKTGRRPYRILVTPGGKQLLVSSWADAAIYQHDANSGTEVGKTRVGPHPTDMVWVNKRAPTEGEAGSDYAARVFVAAANTNNAYSLGVTQDGQLNMLESINVSLTPMHPLGMTPSAVAVDKSGAHLYVVCSDANAVAAVDISAPHSRVMGFIPTGWYPTAVRVLDNDQLVMLNGKGLGSRANPDGPVPTKPNHPLYEGGPVSAPGFVAHIQTGTVAFLVTPNEEQLASFSETVVRNSPYRDEMIYGPIEDEQVRRAIVSHKTA